MEKTYWIIIGDKQAGPYTLEQLLTSGVRLMADTPVWRSDMPDWTVASELPELRVVLAAMGYGGRRPTPAPEAPDEPAFCPPTYLVWSILACLCCCLPGGIVAIIYATKVQPAWDRGDRAAARRYSERAGLWCIISFVAGLIWAPFYTIYTLCSGF